jgi:hypothetical protein
MIPPKCECASTRAPSLIRAYAESVRLEYAISFLGLDEKEKGISQWIHIDDLPIKTMVTLAKKDSFTGRVGDVRTSTYAPAAPQSTT